ncbi:MAG: type II toxin-antitoxin system prevent-host-death family antitoxin [Desulfobacterales bacterium]
MQTINAGIREAKMHLSKLLRYVKNGNEVVLTDRGRPVGRIVPIEAGELSLEARIQKLEDQGVLGPPPKGQARITPLPIPIAGSMAQRYLREEL